MPIMTTEVMVGVECPSCHGETFQMVEREVTIRTKVCLHCARQIDVQESDRTFTEMIKQVEKTDRKQLIKERSYEWAQSLHGKKIIVHWSPSDGHGGNIAGNFEVKGDVYRVGANTNGGYGRVKVIFDQSELHRITWIQEHESYWDGSYHEYTYLHPIIDGIRYSLPFISYICSKTHHREFEKPLCFEITWGRRGGFDIEFLESEPIG